MTEDMPLWTPSRERVEEAALTAFTALAQERTGRLFPDYDALHAWSVEDPGAFWDLVWDYCGVVGDKGAQRLVDGDKMPGARFFPDAKLNFAENLLRRSDDGDAIVFRGEDKVERRVSWRDLAELVSRLQQALRTVGVGVGDRVAGMLPNLPETIAAMLATASLGATWSSCSPDFGERGVLDRFGQIEPKVLFVVDGYWYAGKRIEVEPKLGPIIAQLPTVTQVVVVPYLETADQVAQRLPKAKSLDLFIKPYHHRPLDYVRVGFGQPLYIMFSSGTTGVPKCIVHCVGGVLLQLLKEHILQSDVRSGDRIFYFTTCGWMMWNWLVAGLAAEATLLLYDGSPFHPHPEVLFDYADAERMTLFGTSAKYIDACQKAGLTPATTHDLSTLRLMASTGSPLAPESFDYVYRDIARDIQLASISGGTDICSCFVLGVPTLPVWRGEIQRPGLGMAIEVWNDEGRPVRQEKGELVCVKPAPSMPIAFWNDPEGKKYHAAYFERFPNVWCHGDFAEITEHGGVIIYGRSDATLNPGGVRIGTAEIYEQVQLVPEVIESLAIGQTWDNDVRVVLFVRLREGVTLDEDLEKRIRTQVRTGASPRHVPAKIVQVADIPRTKSGKITELAVRDVVHGREVKNSEALANPESLALFRDLPQLSD
ncbi:acetoacetate--CoA ligase [Segnochrobactrum spirostomi]|uniref:Acetoacetate--CoA ligase n=1 Tax=Segnochrobactrum spirostomi TaxID=2608987 RepID=A0A6A7Y1U5_9HYPH|nr:acetoacetate--CoA ligase [Segnochrobactrum spirostomi]MQT12994.1 acetoacetate--CoA ligase [Segnochrobactrum spirostomi]